MKSRFLLGLGFAAALATAAIAQTIAIPQVSTVGPNDLFQDIVNGAPSAQSYYVSAANLSGVVGNNAPGTNFLIGGKADQNLWQRNTTGSSVTTTVTYGGPDRWAYWSGTNTAMTVSKVTTAAALPTGSANVFRMQRTAGQTGVVQMCMAQEITSKNSYYLQGHYALLDFNVYTGANFSGTGLTAYISYGTGTDEGIAGTASYAYGLNAGGGGSGGWTGQTNATAAVIPLSAVSTAYRVAAVAYIPTTATEIAVSLCYTPVGTAGTTDALYFDNIELRKADGLANFANTTTGYLLSNNVMTTAVNSVVQNATIPPFSIRTYADEAQNQYFYTVVYSEATIYAAAGSQASPIAPCAAVDTTHTNCYITYPVPMRIAPTLTYSAGFASPTSTTQATLGACSAVATAQTVSGAIPTNYGVLVNCTATTIPAAGVASFLYASSGTGKITASAEL
jgi:hypothetical protein